MNVDICDCECHLDPPTGAHARGKSCPCHICEVCGERIKFSAFREHIQTCVTEEAENEI